MPNSMKLTRRWNGKTIVCKGRELPNGQWFIRVSVNGTVLAERTEKYVWVYAAAMVADAEKYVDTVLNVV